MMKTGNYLVRMILAGVLSAAAVSGTALAEECPEPGAEGLVEEVCAPEAEELMEEICFDDPGFGDAGRMCAVSGKPEMVPADDDWYLVTDEDYEREERAENEEGEEWIFDDEDHEDDPLEGDGSEEEDYRGRLPVYDLSTLRVYIRTGDGFAPIVPGQQVKNGDIIWWTCAYA